MAGNQVRDHGGAQDCQAYDRPCHARWRAVGEVRFGQAVQTFGADEIHLAIRQIRKGMRVDRQSRRTDGAKLRVPVRVFRQPPKMRRRHVKSNPRHINARTDTIALDIGKASRRRAVWSCGTPFQPRSSVQPSANFIRPIPISVHHCVAQRSSLACLLSVAMTKSAFKSDRRDTPTSDMLRFNSSSNKADRARHAASCPSRRHTETGVPQK